MQGASDTREFVHAFKAHATATCAPVLRAQPSHAIPRRGVGVAKRTPEYKCEAAFLGFFDESCA